MEFIKRMQARERRFFHCLGYMLTLNFQHLEYDIHDIDRFKAPSGRYLDFHTPTLIGCTCGKVFWRRNEVSPRSL